MLAKELINESNFEESLKVLNESIQNCPQDNIQYADLLYERGNIKNNLSPGEEAVSDFQKALKIANLDRERNIIKVGIYLKGLGSAYSILSDYDNGNEKTLESIRILEVHDPKNEILGYAYSRIGINFNELGNYKESEKYHNKAVNLTKEIFGDTHPEYAVVLSNQAVNYNKMSKQELSVQSYKKALKIFEMYPLERQTNIAITSNNLASVLTNQSKYEEAELFFESAIEMLMLAQPGDSMDLAILQYNLAHNHRKLFNQEESQNLFIKAHDMFVRILGNDHLTTAIAKQGLAINLRELGNLEGSHKTNLEILEIYKKKLDTDSNRIADIYTFLSQDYSEMNEFQKAENYFQETIRIYIKNRGRVSRDVSLAMSKYAEFLDKQERYHESIDFHLEALSIIKELEKNGVEHAKRVHFLAKHYYLTDQSKKAINFGHQAIEIINNIVTSQVGSMRGELLSYLAKYYFENGEIENAIKFADQADVEFEQYFLRFKSSIPTNEIERFSNLKQHYIDHSYWLLMLGSKDSLSRSFLLSQKGSISPISFALRRKDQRKFEVSDNLVIKKHQDLVNKRRLLQKKIDNLSLIVIDEEAKRDLDNFKREKASIDILIKRIGTQIKQEVPEYSATVLPNSFSIEETQNSLNENQLLIKFLVREEGVLVWAVSKKDFHSFFTPIELEKLKDNVNEIRDANLNYKEGLLDYPFNLSHQLYKKLISPALKKSRNVDHIIFVPSDDLHNLSFQSLVISDQVDLKKNKIRWLIKDFTVSILPSISSLINSKNDDSGGSFTSFVGVGDPTLKGENELSSLFTKRGGYGIEDIKSFPALPETNKELSTIAEYIDSPKTLLLLGESAKKENILSSDIGSYDLVSFATHAVNAKLEHGIEEPSLIISGDQSNNPQDWVLTSSEIRELDLNATLVILSACNTASIGSDGNSAYSGLSEAFLYAGAESLLVSQWPIASNASVEISTNMISNYINKKSVSKADSLRISMIKMINGENNVYNHPFFWAPFVLVGSN